jgi:hypothetical protein
MPGDNVIDLAARRRKAIASSLPVLPFPPPARKHGRVTIAMEASSGRVRVVFGDSSGGAEVWLTPEQADHVATELTRFGRAARGLVPGLSTDGEAT